MIFKVTIASLAPLLMHNGQLVDPLNEHAKVIKKLAKVRAKSDKDEVEVSRADWLGGLYYNAEIGPYLPSDMIEATMKDGAKIRKNGKLVAACVVCNNERYPLKYKGPRDVDALMKDPRFLDRRGVGIGARKIMRSRPRFNDWSCDFDLSITPGRLSAEDVKTALEDAGLYVGIGDYRPKFGRFRVELFEEKKA